MSGIDPILLLGGGLLVVGVLFAFSIESSTRTNDDGDPVAKKSLREWFAAGVGQAADRKLSKDSRGIELKTMLEVSGWKLRPAEFLALIGGVSLLVGVAAGVFQGALLGVVAVVFGPVIGWMYLKIKVGKAKAAFEEQLPETLQLLAGSLRAGMSFVQALSAVGHEAPAPTKEELRKVLTENRLGRSVTGSLRDVVRRMDSSDFDWVVAAVEVHQEVGGNLADVLERVAATIRARNRVKGQVKALSAEGRLSGVILAILPPGVFMIMYSSNRDYASRLLTETTGQLILAAASVLVLMGSVVLHRMARFRF